MSGSERLSMKRKAGALVRSIRIALAIGDGIIQKYRIASFLFSSYLYPQPEAPLTPFRIRIRGMCFQIVLSRARSELYALQDVFVCDQYAPGLPMKAGVIFDLGANVGYTTMFFRARYPEARIVAFEPDPANFSRLKTNLEGVQGIELVQAAIAGHTGTHALYVDDDLPMRHSMLPREGAQMKEVDAMTLSDARIRLGAEWIDILKFDIEGAEADMFAHFDEWPRVRFFTGEVHTKLLGERATLLIESLKARYGLAIVPEGSYSMVYGALRD